jgi:hypothetical protein
VGANGLWFFGKGGLFWSLLRFGVHRYITVMCSAFFPPIIPIVQCKKIQLQRFIVYLPNEILAQNAVYSPCPPSVLVHIVDGSPSLVSSSSTVRALIRSGFWYYLPYEIQLCWAIA